MTGKEKAADLRLRKVYKKSLKWYNNQKKVQGGGCAICGRTEKKNRLHVDHAHRCCKKSPVCGKCVRGLLCMICNRKVLGIIEKFRIPVRKIVEYLEKYDKGNPLLNG